MKESQLRVDVHHHISPPAWLNAMRAMGLDNPLISGWTVEKSLEDMDQGGVAFAFTSPPPPQVCRLKAEHAAQIARESNDFAKSLELQIPGRFGTFAMLPLPHIEQSLREIEYAFDTLKVDGIGCLTSYGDKWLGYNEFEPVWAELNRRKATVYTHPTVASGCANLVLGIDDPLIEFGTDTTRAIFTIIFGGFAEKYSDINWIWSHGGGSITAFYERFTVQSIMRPPYAGQFTRDQIERQIRRFYYDTAAVANEVTLSALVRMVPLSQVLFGSDFPYRTASDHTKGLSLFFGVDDLRGINRANALRLFPRLGSHSHNAR